MKLIGIFIIVLLTFVATFAQKSLAEELTQNEFEAECGKPMSDGKIFDYREGKVVRLAEGNKLVFQQREVNGVEKSATLVIHMAGINTQVNAPALAKFLSNKVVDQDATIAGNLRSESDANLYGNVWVASVGDVNRFLLKNGMTSFSEPAFSGVSSYTLCIYKQIANKAKSARVGIWTKR